MNHQSDIMINEVGLRDGLQGVVQPVTTEQRINIITLLIEAGLRFIQVCSFVNPKKIPQMSKAEQLVKQLPQQDGIKYSSFVLNQIGLERAHSVGIKKIETSLSVSESYSRKNMGLSVKDAQAQIMDIVSSAKKAKMDIRAGLQCVWGCAYEQKPDLPRILKLLENLLKSEVEVICLADSIGAAKPNEIEIVLENIIKTFPEVNIALHLHINKFQRENIKLAVDMGVNQFDTSIGGIGGSPYMQGSKGNIATEETVDLLNTLGIRSGIDLFNLAKASRFLDGIIDSAYFHGKLYKLLSK